MRNRDAIHSSPSAENEIPVSDAMQVASSQELVEQRPRRANRGQRRAAVVAGGQQRAGNGAIAQLESGPIGRPTIHA
jgi:hypothetical protein